VDLHRKRSHVVALDSSGEVVVARRIGNAPAEFLRLFAELEPHPVEVAFEATYGWSWLADLLANAGIPARMAHPLATKATSAGGAWVAPPDARQARRLVRTRASLVRSCRSTTATPRGAPAGAAFLLLDDDLAHLRPRSAA
jgi:transposase